MFYYDESWYVNSQNNRYWSTENPHAVHEVPVHDVKVSATAQTLNNSVNTLTEVFGE